LNDYNHAEVPVDILESYFLDGDETALVEAISLKAEVQIVTSAVELGSRGDE